MIPAAGHRDTLAEGEAEDGFCDVCGARLWPEPETPSEPEPEREPIRIVQWATSLFQGIFKAISNLFKIFRKMAGK